MQLLNLKSRLKLKEKLKMKFAILALFLGLFISISCSPIYPIIFIDAAHYQIDEPGRPTPLIYKIPPTRGITIDSSKYIFEFEEGKPLEPNEMQLVISDDEIYSADFLEGSTRHRLDESTLIPIQDSKPFTRFKPGQQIVLAIGKLRPPSDGKAGGLMVMWVGIIRVESEPTME